MPHDLDAIIPASQPWRIDCFVIERLQLEHVGQPPVRIPGQVQITAVLNGALEVHVFAIVLPGPHQISGTIDPEAARLSVLRGVLAFRC